MKKILFYSATLNNYLKNHVWSKKLIIDYFDIEVQKILPTLNLAYKTNPVLIHNTPFLNSYVLDLVYDLDSFVGKKNLSNLLNKEITGVIYDCCSFI